MRKVNIINSRTMRTIKKFTFAYETFLRCIHKKISAKFLIQQWHKIEKNTLEADQKNIKTFCSVFWGKGKTGEN